MKKLLVLLLLLALPLPAFPAAPPPAGYVALTFDDGPSGSITRKLLKGLEERGVRATFFLCGYRMEEYPKVAPLLAEAGHELGLHGYSHKSMKDMGPQELARELEACRELLWEQCGAEAKLLRPPGGCCGEALRELCRREGLPIILWSVDTRDWDTRDAAAIGESMVKNAKDGDIILLHDMWESSVRGALAAVDALKERGFVFVTVSELAERKGVSLEGGSVYGGF